MTLLDKEFHKAMHDVPHINHEQREILKKEFNDRKIAGKMDKFTFKRFMKDLKTGKIEGLSKFERDHAHEAMTKFSDNHLGSDYVKEPEHTETEEHVETSGKVLKFEKREGLGASEFQQPQEKSEMDKLKEQREKTTEEFNERKPAA